MGIVEKYDCNLRMHVSPLDLLSLLMKLTNIQNFNKDWTIDTLRILISSKNKLKMNVNWINVHCRREPKINTKDYKSNCFILKWWNLCYLCSITHIYMNYPKFIMVMKHSFYSVNSLVYMLQCVAYVLHKQHVFQNKQ